jgi:adenosylcobinamide-phosphate synthase
MGGPNTYHGRVVEKPVIGKELAGARRIHIRQACRLMLSTSLLFFMVAATLILLRLIAV